MNFATLVLEKPDNRDVNSLQLSENTKRVLSDKSDDSSRKKSIVSSYNVAAVLGFDPFTTEEEEFQLKVGLKTKPKTDAMRHGEESEKVAAQHFAKTYDKVLFKVPVVVCKENKYVCALSDRITEDGINVEIKVPFSQPVPEDADLDYVKLSKPQYYHQMQLQMHVLDLPATWFVQYGGPPNKHHTLTPETKKLKFPPREVLSVVFVPRDPEWWATHEKKIDDFVRRVLLYQRIEKSLKTPSSYQE